MELAISGSLSGDKLQSQSPQDHHEVGVCWAVDKKCTELDFNPLTDDQIGGAFVGVKKTGKGRRKLGQKKRRMRSRIRHRKK